MDGHQKHVEVSGRMAPLGDKVAQPIPVAERVDELGTTLKSQMNGYVD